ncbi:MAG: hypothetical protein Q7S00_00810, partial [bacterium]|nr:hypothetical protein [bacterium]
MKETMVPFLESVKDKPGSVFFDSCGLGENSYFFEDPVQIVRGNPFATMKESLKSGKKGVWAGVLAYEMEKSWFGLFDRVLSTGIPSSCVLDERS